MVTLQVLVSFDTFTLPAWLILRGLSVWSYSSWCLLLWALLVSRRRFQTPCGGRSTRKGICQHPDICQDTINVSTPCIIVWGLWSDFNTVISYIDVNVQQNKAPFPRTPPSALCVSGTSCAFIFASYSFFLDFFSVTFSFSSLPWLFSFHEQMRTRIMRAFILMSMVMHSSIAFNVLQPNICQPPFALVSHLLPPILQGSSRYIIDDIHHFHVLFYVPILNRYQKSKFKWICWQLRAVVQGRP